MIKQVIHAGSSDASPANGCKVFVHYTGRLLDGTKFDSSRDRDEKFSFDLGKSQVIKAWDLGVASMKRGEICKLTCKPEYAYGAQGSPPTIPANATLLFDIELFDWEFEEVSDTNDKGITRQVLQEGEKFDTPNDGAKVEIEYKATCKGNIFDERSVTFGINENEYDDLPKAVENVIKKMKKNEKSRFYVKSKYAFGKEGSDDFDVPSNADVEYEILLKNFEKAKEAWEMNDDEKIEQSEIIKAKGTEFLKSGKYKKAVSQYKKIKDFLDYREDSSKAELDQKWNTLKLAGLLNLALCYMKIKNYEEAMKNCDAAIEIDNANEKAYFRRGESHLYRHNYEEARADFAQVKVLNPDNKLAVKRLNECLTFIKKQKENEKKTFAGMFDKFAKQDEKDEIRRKQAAKEAKKVKPDPEGGDAINGETPTVQVNGD